MARLQFRITNIALNCEIYESLSAVVYGLMED